MQERVDSPVWVRLLVSEMGLRPLWRWIGKSKLMSGLPASAPLVTCTGEITQWLIEGAIQIADAGVRPRLSSGVCANRVIKPVSGNR